MKVYDKLKVEMAAILQQLVEAENNNPSHPLKCTVKGSLSEVRKK